MNIPFLFYKTFHQFSFGKYNVLDGRKGAMVTIRRKKGNRSGVMIATFGLGLMLAFFLPIKWLVVMLSAAVIILGLLYAKSCC